jgi:RNA polymerase sigma-54 factor
MINNTLDIRASQQLAMTPRLQQAIQLLQMSSLDLNDFIQEQILENPLLLDEAEDKNHNSSDTLIYDIKNNGNDEDEFINNISEIETLKEYLSKQFLPSAQNQIERFLGQIMIDLLTDEGYLLEDLNELADRFHVSYEVILNVLKKLQECEPVGVFSRNLKECFTLQLKDINLYSEEMEHFLQYIDLLPQEGIKGVSKASQLNIVKCEEFLSVLKKLNPKPGLLFGKEPVTPLIPDIIVSQCKITQEWNVELNQDALPKIFLNTRYYQELQEKCKKGQEIIYLREKKNHANWLVQSLMQRSTNILKVSRAIIDFQKSFFEKGLNSLYPLTLKDIALKTNLHESTVSRLTTNKYMETPLGILDFKFFFVSKIHTNKKYKNENPEKILSSKAVMEVIKKLINAESPTDPLADEDLVILLKQQGIDIARRTVAKYRTHLNIENSSKRRK